MASFEPIDFDPLAPPRPTTPPIRRGFLLALLALSVVAGLVYGIPYVAGRTGYAYEAGPRGRRARRSRKLDKDGVIKQSSALFRLASTAVAPAVVNISNWRTAPAGLAPGHAPARGGDDPGRLGLGRGHRQGQGLRRHQ